MQPSEWGTLYGVGVGPGDPGLLTVKAVEVIKGADVIFTAASPKKNYSRALDVVSHLLGPERDVRWLIFPMHEDKAALKKAWDQNASDVLEVLRRGKDAAFLTIGDSLTYSTYGYLWKAIKEMEPRARAEAVPGITSYHAAAAKLNRPLVEGRESLLIVSGAADPSAIPELAGCAENLVIMKAYRNLDGILDALGGLPGKRPAALVSNCGRGDEQVHEDAYALKGAKAPYLSLILAKGPAWDGER